MVRSMTEQPGDKVEVDRLRGEDNQPISGRAFVGIIGFSLIVTGIFVQLLPLIPGVYVTPATAPQSFSSILWVCGLTCFAVSILNLKLITESYTVEKSIKLSMEYLDR